MAFFNRMLVVLGAVIVAALYSNIDPQYKAVSLEDVIAVFSEKMKSGEPWPATQSEDHNSEAATPC
jgi:hypothetical protein